LNRFYKLDHDTQAKDLKLYAGTATSFSPLLLSCAAIIRQCSKAGTFESVPDWTSVAEDDPRIKTHPRFEKTLGYRRPSLVEVPADLDPQDAASASATAVPSAAPVSPTSAPPALPASQSLDNLIAAPAAEHKLVSPAPDPMAAGVQSPPHLPVKFNLFVAGTKKKSGMVAPQVGNTKKRKAEDEDTDVDDPKSHPPSSKPRQKRKKKFLSADEDKVCTGTIYVKVCSIAFAYESLTQFSQSPMQHQTRIRMRLVRIYPMRRMTRVSLRQRQGCVIHALCSILALIFLIACRMGSGFSDRNAVEGKSIGT
jgi:hypothetical protein